MLWIRLLLFPKIPFKNYLPCWKVMTWLLIITVIFGLCNVSNLNHVLLLLSNCASSTSNPQYLCSIVPTTCTLWLLIRPSSQTVLLMLTYTNWCSSLSGHVQILHATRVFHLISVSVFVNLKTQYLAIMIILTVHSTKVSEFINNCWFSFPCRDPKEQTNPMIELFYGGYTEIGNNKGMFSGFSTIVVVHLFN